MNRRAALAAIVWLSMLAPASLAAGAAEDLADAALPRVSELAAKLAHARWARRVDELMASAPLSAKPGPAWKHGDPHWEAARDAMVATIDGWVAPIAADDEARDIVRRKFESRLDAGRAKAMAAALAAGPTRDYPSVCDSIHLAVLFAKERNDLEVGSRDFSTAFASWLKALGVPSEPPDTGPELTALMKSDAGSAYATARGLAIDALVTRLDGKIQLDFHDAQQSILAAIEAKAKECAKAKHAK